MQIMVQTHAEAKSPKCLVGGKPKGYHSEETDKSDARQPMAGTWDFLRSGAFSDTENGTVCSGQGVERNLNLEYLP